MVEQQALEIFGALVIAPAAIVLGLILAFSVTYAESAAKTVVKLYSAAFLFVLAIIAIGKAVL